VHLTGLRRTSATTRSRGAAPLIRGRMAPLLLSSAGSSMSALRQAPCYTVNFTGYGSRLLPLGLNAWKCVSNNTMLVGGAHPRLNHVASVAWPCCAVLPHCGTMLMRYAPYHSALLRRCPLPLRLSTHCADWRRSSATVRHCCTAIWPVCTALPQCDTTLVGCGCLL
jgi:hypothetical protein